MTTWPRDAGVSGLLGGRQARSRRVTGVLGVQILYAKQGLRVRRRLTRANVKEKVNDAKRILGKLRSLAKEVQCALAGTPGTPHFWAGRRGGPGPRWLGEWRLGSPSPHPHGWAGAGSLFPSWEGGGWTLSLAKQVASLL